MDIKEKIKKPMAYSLNLDMKKMALPVLNSELSNFKDHIQRRTKQVK